MTLAAAASRTIHDDALEGALPFIPTLRTEGHWLVIEAAALPGELQPWHLIELSTRTAGNAKFVLSRCGTSLRLSVDIPLEDGDEPPPGRIEEARESIALLARAQRGDAPAESVRRGARPDAAPDLTRLCEGAGWPFTARPSGALAVPLEAGPAHVMASVEALDEGVRVAAELARPARLSLESQSALGLMLLRAGSAVCLARPWVRSEGDQVAAGWEVWLSQGMGAAQLGHALSAASVACRFTAAEARALQDRDLAGAHLAMQRWPE